MASSSCGIPIIDMDECEGLCEKIVKACEEWGCFRVVNHGVPVALMSEMKAVARSLLDLPVEIKERNTHSVPNKGYAPINLTCPFFEALSVYDIASPRTLDHFCHQLAASPPQREILFKYSQALYDLAQDLGCKMMQGTGLVEMDLFKGWLFQFRLNKYNYTPQSVGLTGVIMHTDPGFLTILQDDEIIGGLEVVDNSSGELVPVDPMPDTLLINIGDVAKALSNGRFCNVKHRVQCYEASIRISIVLFVLGPRNAKVEAPPKLVDSEHPRLYVPFDFEEYRMLRITTKVFNGGALELHRATKS